MKNLILFLILSLSTSAFCAQKLAVHSQCQICGVAVDGSAKKLQHRSTDAVSDPQNLLITREAVLKCRNGHEVRVPVTERVPKVQTVLKPETVEAPTKAEPPRPSASHTKKLATPLPPPMPAAVWQKGPTT